MQSIQLLKTRIGSIASTRQITQSMRLVSTAKVQRCRARMSAAAPFLEENRRLIAAALHSLEGEQHPYLTPRQEGKATAVVVVNADRGLCGGYNINVVRRAYDLMETLPGDIRLVTVGAKARDYCRRRKHPAIAASFTGVSETPMFDDAAEIAHLLLSWYDAGEVDEILVVSTQFVSMLSQHVRVQRLLPLELPQEPLPGMMRCEPAGSALLSRTVPFYAASFLYGILLEAATCEQSARITSMDNAVKNSEEMMESLQLLYNQARQGAITQEITEIVTGANAVRREGE
ncbi:MAG: ATP synthase F1 subunit gamma [Oscillospiraceae bacterium]|jgi:F-type H+-transporting ATPase subunit gamma